MATINQDGHWKTVEGTLAEIRSNLASDSPVKDVHVIYDGTDYTAVYRVE